MRARSSGRYPLFRKCRGGRGTCLTHGSLALRLTSLAKRPTRRYPDGTRSFREVVEQAGRPVLYVADQPAEVGSRFVSLGRYEISGGRFEVELDEGDRERIAAVRGFRFRPAGVGAAESESERALREERLRALGYVE